ncbi:hypothetical protein BDN67DRAFT_1069358 [Paxillus ammoniavirescens]|nr:hypothetical protein BDN67DRAFT_1069358 [Paxillus ammoniavirescens]
MMTRRQAVDHACHPLSARKFVNCRLAAWSKGLPPRLLVNQASTSERLPPTPQIRVVHRWCDKPCIHHAVHLAGESRGGLPSARASSS